MEFKANTLSNRLLEYLHENGAVVRKNLYAPFATYEYTGYTRAVKRLIDAGYIEHFIHDNIDYLRLTTDGKTALDAQLAGSSQMSASTSGSHQHQLAAVTGLCAAGGIINAVADKPPLESFFADSAHMPENEKKDFENLLQCGIFYSTGEIGSAMLHLGFTSVLSSRQALSGIVLRDSNLTYIYYTGDKPIVWKPRRESKTVAGIADFFKKSPILAASIRLEAKPTCIVCGKGFDVVPLIVFGTDGSGVRRTKGAWQRMRSQNLGNIFFTAYYITADHRGAANFKHICLSSSEERSESCDKWFAQTKGATRDRRYRYCHGRNGKRERIAFMPCIELIALANLIRLGNPCHFIVARNNQDGVARVMGSLMLSAKSPEGMRLKYALYDKLGAKLPPQI